ncbi:MAG TPA: riboflavin biosynthesis protein RibF [Candidatus Limnocylindria bacterium]|nr:riboflavin biosynthesis protein RibF [Candidatus Limnocylindria bacterium]
MQLVDGVDALPADRPLAVTLGIFDGVHRGHLHCLRETIAVARRLEAAPVAITFEPHPAAVLRGAAPPLICPPEERLSRLAAAGVELGVVQRFDHQFAAQSAEQFLRRLADGRRLAGLVMTAESAFGHDREGTLAEVRRLSRPLGFELIEAAQLVLDGGPVSSTRIRELIEGGRLAAAARLLGRPYAVAGEIVHGDGRGRELGYPTANFGFAAEVCLPPNGIYAVRVGWGGADPLAPERRADGVASLGVRPTFGAGARVLEAFLFDISEDLYGERMRLEFVRCQRGEKRFSSVADLIAQMERDAARARAILRRRSPDRTEHVLDSRLTV